MWTGRIGLYGHDRVGCRIPRIEVFQDAFDDVGIVDDGDDALVDAIGMVEIAELAECLMVLHRPVDAAGAASLGLDVCSGSMSPGPARARRS